MLDAIHHAFTTPKLLMTPVDEFVQFLVIAIVFVVAVIGYLFISVAADNRKRNVR